MIRTHLTRDSCPRQATNKGPQHAIPKRHSADTASNIDTRPGDDADEAEDGKADPG